MLHYYARISAGRSDPEPAKGEPEYDRLWELAKQAMAILGGQSEPSLTTLADYDHQRNGPLLGVSNEGGATAAIRHGALAAPRCQLTGDRTPFSVGVVHDAERLGAIGEVVVGPDEYADIRLACQGRMLTTTNVGARVNVRSYLPPPVVRIKPGGSTIAVAAAMKALREYFEPFRQTPSGRARALTVFIRFGERTTSRQAQEICSQLVAAVEKGEFCDPKRHHLGLLVAMKTNRPRTQQGRAAVDLAKLCGLTTVSLDGPALSTNLEAGGAGLLNYFPAGELDAVLDYAAKRGIGIVPHQRLDPATTARHIWAGLSVARNMGFDLGKFGLVPLTFEEQKEVIARIQYWFHHWCAAPVCYVDHPIVTVRRIYYGGSLVVGLRRWLEMAAKLKVRVVLIDTVKKSEGKRLLKDGPNDENGYLSLDEVRTLNAWGNELGLKVLWAGGITLPQAFEYGKLAVFGIYVTSAVASAAPLGRRYRRDPALLNQRVPQPEAVTRVKLLMEAGFLVRRLRADGCSDDANQIEEAARQLIASLPGKDAVQTSASAAKLHDLTTCAWKEQLRSSQS